MQQHLEILLLQVVHKIAQFITNIHAVEVQYSNTYWDTGHVP